MAELLLTEWDVRGPDTPVLRGRVLETPEARRLTERFGQMLQIEELREGLRVRAFAHVGRVQVEDLTITVRPKIESEALLGLVRYAYGFRRLQILSTARYQDAGSLFQDLLVAQLLSEARELIRSGLARRYHETREDLPAPRGRIDFATLATRPTWNRISIPCRQYPRSMDNVLNRALRAGLELAAGVAQDRGLIRELKRTARLLGDVAGQVELTGDLLSQAERCVTRLSTAYRPALRLIELLYASSWLALQGAGTLRLPGFLFDMNRFFQALVSRFLHDHLDTLDVTDEHRLAGFMRYARGRNPRRVADPTPRPDFAVTKGRRVVAFLDAKYRDLWARDLPREMLYQLAVYALSHRSGGNAAIIYPMQTGVEKEAVIEFAEPESGQPRARIALRPFDLNRAARVVAEGDRREGARMAQSLACPSEKSGSREGEG